MLVGLVFGLLVGLDSGRKPLPAPIWSWRNALGGLGSGLAGGLLFGLLSWSIGGLVFGLLGGLLVSLGVGQLVKEYGKQVDARIEPTEALSWSWNPNVLIALVGGLLGGLLFELIFGQVLWLWLISGLLVGLVLGLIFGISRKRLPEHLHLSPNEGIRRSTKYGLLSMLIALIIVLLISLGVGLVSKLGTTLVYWLFVGLASLTVGLLTGLRYGLGPSGRHVLLRFY